MRLVHDVISDLEVRKRRDLLARLLLTRAGLFLRDAEDVAVGNDHELDLRILKAVRQRERHDGAFPGPDAPAVFPKRAGGSQLAQRGKQALTARHAAGEQRDAPAVLLPTRHISAQVLQLPLIAGNACAVELNDVLGGKAAIVRKKPVIATAPFCVSLGKRRG